MKWKNIPINPVEKHFLFLQGFLLLLHYILVDCVILVLCPLFFSHLFIYLNRFSLIISKRLLMLRLSGEIFFLHLQTRKVRKWRPTSPIHIHAKTVLITVLSCYSLFDLISEILIFILIDFSFFYFCL